MCEPMTILAVSSLALTAASTYSQVQQQEAAKTATEEYNQKQYDNTMTAYRYNNAKINFQQEQERTAAGQKIAENNIKGREAQSRAATAAGESGVGGLSVAALLSDLAGQQGKYNNSVENNYGTQYYALDSERMNVWSGAASQINSLKTPQQPDYFGAGLKIADASMNAYGTYKKYNK